MNLQQVRKLAGLNEELDVSSGDPLATLTKEMKELQQELATAKKSRTKEIVNQIEQDIFDLGKIIERKKQRS